jgi:hypothetical protein
MFMRILAGEGRCLKAILGIFSKMSTDFLSQAVAPQGKTLGAKNLDG